MPLALPVLARVVVIYHGHGVCWPSAAALQAKWHRFTALLQGLSCMACGQEYLPLLRPLTVHFGVDQPHKHPYVMAQDGAVSGTITEPYLCGW